MAAPGKKCSFVSLSLAHGPGWICVASHDSIGRAGNMVKPCVQWAVEALYMEAACGILWCCEKFIKAGMLVSMQC